MIVIINDPQFLVLDCKFSPIYKYRLSSIGVLHMKLGIGFIWIWRGLAYFQKLAQYRHAEAVCRAAVRIGATPEMAPGAGSSEECQSTEEICFVCSTVIHEATPEREGDAVLLCEGRHKRWAHTSCVGVSDVLYKDIQSCETPSMCRECSKEAAKALQELPLLQEEVKSLKAESTCLREELTDLRALVSSLHSSLSSL